MNILKELYLDKTNKDILRSVLQFMNVDTRYRITLSTKQSSFFLYICNNCFNQCCESFDLACGDSAFFCDRCVREHYENTTSNFMFHTRCVNGFTTQSDFQCKHACEFGEGMITGLLPKGGDQRVIWKDPFGFINWWSGIKFESF